MISLIFLGCCQAFEYRWHVCLKLIGLLCSYHDTHAITVPSRLANCQFLPAKLDLLGQLLHHMCFDDLLAERSGQASLIVSTRMGASDRLFGQQFGQHGQDSF